MKRGQIQGQVFIYILTLVITAGILLYGYKAIIRVNDTSKQVELVKFENDLRKDFEEMSSTYRKVRLETYYVPSEVKEIYFYQETGDIPSDINPLIYDSILDTDNNVFLVIGNSIKAMNLGKINLGGTDSPILHIPINNNRLKLRLEGLGNGVSVEQS